MSTSASTPAPHITRIEPVDAYEPTKVTTVELNAVTMPCVLTRGRPLPASPFF